MTNLLFKISYCFFWFCDQFFSNRQIRVFEKIRNFIYYSLYLPSLKNRQNSLHPVQEIHVASLSKETIRNLKFDRAIVFRGVIPNDVIRAWNWEELSVQYGETLQSYSDSKKFYFSKGELNMKDILASVLSESPEISLTFGDLLYKHPELVERLQIKRWFAIEELSKSLNQTWQAFASGKGKFTKLHTELGNLLSIQLLGKKKWILFDPRYSVNVNPKVNWRMYLESSDFISLNNFAEMQFGASGHYVELEAGDVLYCPSFFWHYVWSEEPSFSVAYKWTDLRTLALHPFLTSVVLSSREPTIFSKLPFFRRTGAFHPPPA